MDSYGQQTVGGGILSSYEKTNTNSFDYGLDINLQEKKVVVVEEPITATIRAVLIGSSFGASLAREITASGANGHLIMSSAGEGQHVTKPLLEVNDVSAINYWVRALKQCPRVAPSNRCTYVVCNQDNVDEFQNWARQPMKCDGFNPKNLLNNGVTSEQGHTGVAADLLFAIETALGYDNHVLLIDGDYLPEPDFNLNRIVEHSVIRGKDTVTYVTLAPEMGADVADHVMLDLERNAGGHVPMNPEVLAIHPYPQSTGPRVKAAMGPVMFLRRSTLPLVKQFFTEVAPGLTCPYYQLTGHLFQYLQSKVTFYGLETKYMFSLKTLDAFLYADALFEHHAREKGRAAEKFKTNDTDSSLSMSQADVRKRMIAAQFEKEEARFGNVKQAAIAGECDLDTLLPKFNERYAASLHVRLAGERDSSVPERFADASTFRHKSIKQHACYITSNNYYGLKQAGQQEMPMRWHGVKGDFTSNFRGAMHHNTGFVTAKTNSKVHRHLDDF